MVSLTSRASSTDNFPLGASETSATSSVASTSTLLSPASDILNVEISHKSKAITDERTKECVLFDSRMLHYRVMSSSAFVDRNEN